MSQLIHLRIEESIQNDIKSLIDQKKYTTQSEFIKEAIRNHITYLYQQEAIKQIAKLRGCAKEQKVTREDRAKAVQEGLRSGRDIFKEYGLK